MTNVAIHGLGRIGRTALKIIRDVPELELVAVNDIGSVDDLAYLLKYEALRISKIMIRAQPISAN